MVNDSPPRSAALRLTTSVSLYTLARSAAGAMRVLAVPFIAHAVSAEAFGTLATLWVPMVVVHGLCDLGLGTAAIRYATECGGATERRSLFAAAILARVSAGLVATALVVLLHEPLARWLTGSPHNGRMLLILALTRPLPMVFDVFVDELRSRGAMKEVSGLVFFSAFAVQALGLVFAVGLRQGLDGLVWARFFGEILAIVPPALLCFRFVGARPNRADFRKLLAFGWPLGMVSALGTLRYLDRPIVRVLSSVEHVAAYELAARLVGPVGLFNIALATVLEPFVYGLSQSRRTPGLVDGFVRVYVTVFAVVAMALSLFGPDLVTLFAPEAYRGAIYALPSLAFAATCEGLQRASGIGADLAKRTRVWAVSSVLTLAIGLCCAALLVPRLGLSGAGFGWMIAITAATLVVYRSARTVSGIELPIGTALSIIWGGSVLGTAGASQAWSAPVRTCVLVGFALVVRAVMRPRFADLRGQIGNSP